MTASSITLANQWPACRVSILTTEPIYVGTFTKSLFPGLRIGYVVLPPQLVKPMTVARTLLDGDSAPMAQLTLARFAEGGHFGAYVRTMRGVYAERLEVLANLVRKQMAEFVEPRVPIGGLQMPCLLICDLPERMVIDAGRRVGIELLGLSALHASGVGDRDQEAGECTSGRWQSLRLPVPRHAKWSGRLA